MFILLYTHDSLNYDDIKQSSIYLQLGAGHLYQPILNMLLILTIKDCMTDLPS